MLFNARDHGWQSSVQVKWGWDPNALYTQKGECFDVWKTALKNHRRRHSLTKERPRLRRQRTRGGQEEQEEKKGITGRCFFFVFILFVVRKVTLPYTLVVLSSIPSWFYYFHLPHHCPKRRRPFIHEYEQEKTSRGWRWQRIHCIFQSIFLCQRP